MDSIVGISNANYSNNDKELINVSNFNILFYMGIFFIPFDNLFFAPSAGWATIAPFFFLLYLILNFDSFIALISKKNIFVFLIFLLVGPIRGLIYSNYSNVIVDTGTIILGFSFYFSLKIYDVVGNESHKNIFCRIVFISYLLAFFYGVLSRVPFDFIEKTMVFLSKRGNPTERLRFTFTEASFISMHIYGILFPVAIFFKKKNIFILGIFFVIFTLIFGDSARFYLDTYIALSIGLTWFAYKKGIKFLILFLVLFVILSFSTYQIVINYVPRIVRVLESGFSSDASVYARWFRVASTYYGFDFKTLVLGNGISGAWIPFNSGYDYVYSNFPHSYYMEEIISIKGSLDSSIYCMPLRIISEFGIIGLLLCIYKLFSKRYFLYLLLLIYLYLQFDSYAFFAIWIYLYIKDNINFKRSV